MLYVGQNVGGSKRWSIDQIIVQTTAVRASLGLDVSASYVPQRGVWDSGHGVVHEDSVQIVLLKPWHVRPDEWLESTLRTAELLRGLLLQESVLAEIGPDAWEITADVANANQAAS